MILDFLGLFLILSGFVIGLGAVNVIDLHGFFGQRSAYWTEATIRTHKITKPLIWLGIILCLIGGFTFYRSYGFSGIPLYQLIISVVLIINGLFLSFYVSPFLLQREKDGKANEILPKNFQQKIFISFIISDLGWWTNLLLLTYFLLQK